MMLRRILIGCVLAVLAAAGLSRAQMAADTSVTAPPVAPPLKKGSPLDHLTNDVKLDELPVGYHEGNDSALMFMAHRGLDPEGGMGWGWIRKGDDDWGGGKWVALQEQPGLAVAPFRKLKSRDGDENWEYKFWGHYASYKAYDPHLDEMLPVFVLQGYQVVGPANPLKLRVGPPDRPHSRGSGASSRPSNKIQSNRDID